MLTISHDTLQSFGQSLMESDPNKEKDFIQEKFEELDQNNPVLANVILSCVEKANQEEDKYSAIQQMLVGLLSVYGLIQFQHEAEQLDKEIKL